MHNFQKELEEMSDYSLMVIYHYKAEEYRSEAFDMVRLEYGKRVEVNPNLEFYYPEQVDGRRIHECSKNT